MLPARSLQDEMLRSYIETVFNKYDTDRNGTLDAGEMTGFFNDLFRALQINVTVTPQQSLEAIKSIDQNSDGAVSKEELFTAFKKMLNPYHHSHAGSSRPLPLPLLLRKTTGGTRPIMGKTTPKGATEGINTDRMVTTLRWGTTRQATRSNSHSRATATGKTTATTRTTAARRATTRPT